MVGETILRQSAKVTMPAPVLPNGSAQVPTPPRRNMLKTVTSLLLVVLLACADPRPAATSALVRDSAGIRIVENRAPQWTEGTGWKVDPSPILDIGSDGDSGEQFGQIQDVLRLADGRLIVAEGSTAELRVYTDSGRYIRSIGRRGEGPGEFIGLGLVRSYRGDSLLAYDYQLRRISIFDRDGHFGRGVNLHPPDGTYPDIEGATVDGGFIGLSSEFPSGAIKSGTVRTPMHLFRFGPEGELVDTLGAFPGYETGIYNETNGNNHMRISFTIPFGHQASVVARPTETLVGANDSYEIRSYDAQGDIRRILRRETAPVPVTQQMIDAVNAEEDAQNPKSDPASRARVAKVRAVIVYPRTLPAFQDFHVDDGGYLWVRSFNAPGDTIPRFTVFDSTGQMLGDVQSPRHFEVTGIGAAWLVGIWKDENEVQHVRMYAIRK